MREIGQRIYAISHGDQSARVLYVYGPGVYEGIQPAIAGERVGRGLFAELRADGEPGTKLRLDTGVVVWGDECWWSDEESMRAKIAAWVEDGYTVKVIEPDGARPCAVREEVS